MKRIYAFIFFGSAFYLLGCYYDKFNELHPLDGYVNTCDENLPDTYDSVAHIIILSNCISCHNSDVRQGDIVLETYDELKHYVSTGQLMGALRHQSGYQPMPPNTSLRDCDIEQLQQWIDNGMPQ
jgi:hypothetical protein